MKKFISFALIAAMAVTTLVGCGNKGAKADGGSSDAAITVMSREDGSGTRGAFIELFGIEEEDNRRGKYHKQYFRNDVFRSK